MADVEGTPLVSVLIPAHEAGAWVGEAVESALSQSWPRVEVLALDDGSSDDTADVLAGFGDRIGWERTPWRGAGAARNRLLERARGAWVQYLDADDLLLPAKIETQLRPALASGADLVVSPSLTQSGKRRFVPRSPDPWVSFLEARLGVTTSNLFRRDALRAAGGWDETRRAAQEQDLVGRLLQGGARVAFVAEPLCVKRSVNPHSLWRSIWRDDPKAAREAHLSVVTDAVRHLLAAGALTPERRRAAGLRFLLMARGSWSRGDPGWREILARAGELGLDRAALLGDRPAAYRLVYRAAGFDAAERARARADRAAAGVRRALAGGSRRLRRRARRALRRVRGR